MTSHAFAISAGSTPRYHQFHTISPSAKLDVLFEVQPQLALESDKHETALALNSLASEICKAGDESDRIKSSMY